MIKPHYVHIDHKTLYQLLISELRYSINRDNGLASGTTASIIEKYLPKMGDKFKRGTAKQLYEELSNMLNTPYLYGARKHEVYDKETGRDFYISDYEYKNGSFQKEKLDINDDIVFEDEITWKKLLIFLEKYIKE